MDIHYTYVLHVISAIFILYNIVGTRNEIFLPAWKRAARQIEAEIQQPKRTRAQNLDNFNASNEGYPEKLFS